MDEKNMDGMNVENTSVDTQKSGAKKILIAVVAAVAAVLLIALAIVGVIASNPFSMVENAFEKTLSATNNTEFGEYLNKVANGGSVELVVDTQNLSENILGTKIDGEVSAKFYFNAEELRFAAGVGAALSGEELASAQLYIDELTVAILSEALLGDDAYGIELDKIVENFSHSEFGEDGAFSLGIEDDQIEEYMELMEIREDMMKDAEKVVAGVLKAAKKSIKANAVIEKVGGSIRVGGEDVSTNDVIITIEGEALVNIIRDVLTYVESDKKLAAFIDDYADILASYTGGEVDGDDIADEFYDAIEEAIDSVEDYDDEIEDCYINVVFNIGKSSGMIVGVTAEVEYDKETVYEVEFVCGPTMKDLAEISLKLKSGYGDKITVSYEVEENSKDSFEATFKCKQDSETLVRVDLAWDKKDGDFEVSLENEGYVTFELEGKMLEEKNTTVVEFEKFRTPMMEIDIEGISLVVSKSDKMPKIDDFKDVLTMKEDDFYELRDNVMAAIEEIVSSGDFGEDFDFGLGGDIYIPDDDTSDDYWSDDYWSEEEWADTVAPEPSYGW